MMRKLNKKLILTGYLNALMVIFAMSMTMLGPIMPVVIEENNLRLSQGGLLTVFQSLGGIIAIVIGGIVADRISKSKLVGLAFLLFSLAMFCLIFVDVYILILLIFFLFGAAGRSFDSIVNAYVSDLHTEKRGFHLNVLHTFFGIGALLGPIYATYLLDLQTSWKMIFSILGICGLALIVFMPLFNITSNHSDDSSIDKEANPFKHFGNLLNYPAIWLLCAIMILYLGSQSILSTWIPMYMETNMLASQEISSLALSMMWFGVIIGRIGSAWLVGRVSPMKLLLIGSLFGGIIIALGVQLQNPVFLVVSVCLGGVFTGATIPLLVTIAADSFPAHTGSASAMIFLSGSISTMFFPWFAGLIAEFLGFQVAMSLSWAGLFLILPIICISRKLSL